MQIQTTTTTTENIIAANVPFTVTIFEQTTTAFCDTCPNQASGTKEGLENSGWNLGKREEFCPNCNQ
jgi:hypothetical protein